jgi:pyruvate dehydrogenase E2 component (dihydrolipoamide acetyltransferase)
MIQEVTLPEISENVESGNVISVLVSQGDTVSEDQPLLEIETDKASVEVPSTAAGTVKEILVSEGDDVKVGAVIAKIETEGGGAGETPEQEEAEEAEEPEAQEEEAQEEEAEEGPKKEAGKAEKREEGAQAAAQGVETAAAESTAEPEERERPAPGGGPEIPKSAGGKVPASPSTRRLAREIGVDITQVSGTGPGGRVTAEDVKRHSRESRGASAGGGAAAPAAAQAGGGMVSAFTLPDFSKWGETRREKLNNVRRITGENTQAAWQTIPHVTQFDEADVTALEEFRKRFSKKAEKQGVKLTVTSILMKVVARALRRFPRFNASLDAQAGEIVYKEFINISVAADTDRGLLVPVVRKVDKKSIMTLSAELGDLARRAREKKIKPDEMEGGTFTISNLGGIGGTGFTPVVFPPQVAIMGVARAETKPVWREGEFVPRLMLPLSLSYDHRVIDGADGARFLRWVCESLEQPLFMELEGDDDE